MGIEKSIYQGTLLGKILGFSTKIFHPGKLFSFTQNDKFADSALDDRTSSILAKTEVPAGVFIDRHFSKADRMVLIMDDKEDGFLLDYAQRLISNNNTQVLLIHLGNGAEDTALKERVRLLQQNAPNHLSFSAVLSITPSYFDGMDLLMTSYNTWSTLVNNQTKALIDAPSTLIVRQK